MSKYAFIFLALLGCWPLHAQSPQTNVAIDFRTNSGWTNGVAPGYRPSAGTGLTLNIGPGTAACGIPITYAGGTLTLADNSTNYVYLNADSSCGPNYKTTAFTALDTQIAVVVTASGAITSIADVRSPFVNQEVGVVLRTVSGASDTFLATDRGNQVVYTDASAVSSTLPPTSTAGFGNGYFTNFIASGAGGVTVTTSGTFVGGTTPTTLVVTQGVGCSITSLSTSYYPVCSNAASGTTLTIARGSQALGTSAITNGTCATVVTTAATGVTTADNIMADFNADPTSTLGYEPGAMLTILKYPTSGNVNFKVCNNTSSPITPGAATLNWRVVR
jgi:hypothetical protein